MSVFSSNLKIGQLIGYFFLFLSFWLTFFSAYLISFNVSYIIGILLFTGLLLLINSSPIIFIVVFLISLFLFLISPSPTINASLFPVLGFLFSGSVKFKVKGSFNLYLRISAYLFFVIFYLFVPDDSNASHNYLSVILVYILIVEFLIYRSISKWYIPLILFSFFIIGNRSSIFLLMLFFRSKIFVTSFLFMGLFFILMTLGEIEIFGNFQLFFDEGGILNRSYGETRGSYIEEFLSKFNFFDLSYRKWNFFEVPQTLEGFYDLHNSFLTLIVRDSYLGLFKIILWVSQILFIPFGMFTGISMRAYYDTFLLGGVNDILVYSLIGQNIRTYLQKFKLINS
jgi:hypothetical protein